jgi:hypothetical protein
VKNVSGRDVKVASHTQIASNAKIRSVVTIGKDELNGAGTTRAILILDAFRDGDALISSPFVRKIFFPDYPLHTLKWPKLPQTLPKINFTYRQLNASQKKAVEKCLSNGEEDRHVVIVVRPRLFVVLVPTYSA